MTWDKSTLVALLALLFAYGCTSEVEEVAQADLVIHTGTVITGTGEVLEDAAVVVSNGRIQDVSADPVDVEADQVFSMPRHTLLPGLIDTHVHLLTAADSDVAMARYVENDLPAILNAYLGAGFTAVLDNGGMWPTIADVRDRAERGELKGPRLFILGPVFTALGGHPATTVCRDNPWCREHGAVEVADEQTARQAVGRIVERNVDGIKVVRYTGGRPKLELDLLRSIVEQARVHGLSVFVHTHTVEDTTEAVEAGAARFVHLPGEGAVEGTDLVQLLVEREIPMATTIGPGSPFAPDFDPDDRLWFETQKANVAELVRSHVVIAYGTDFSGGSASERFRWEVQSLQEAGLTAQEVLTTLTRDAAVYLGRDRELGTIEAGKLADLLIVDGNPLEDLSALQNVAVVLKGGEVVVDKR